MSNDWSLPSETLSGMRAQRGHVHLIAPAPKAKTKTKNSLDSNTLKRDNEKCYVSN